MKHTAGFTVVELVVVIVVSSMLALGIFQMLSSVNGIATESARRTTAGNIAYNNMRKYANGQKPLWFNCVGDDGSEVAPFSDGKTKPSATGQVLMNTTSNTSINKLPTPIVQTVVAIAPYGCGSSASGLPIRVQAQVTYGSGSTQRTVTHATYVSY